MSDKNKNEPSRSRVVAAQAMLWTGVGVGLMTGTAGGIIGWTLAGYIAASFVLGDEE